MYHIIVFSFNRAMQCESVLRSILQHVKTPQLTVSVVWRATGEHLDGYALLRRLYEAKGVRFHQQSGRAAFFRDTLPRLWMPRNLYHWLRYDYLRRADNFKTLLEQVIAETPADFVSFNTDDNLYYRDELLPEAAFTHIRDDPYQASYRVYLGANLSACPRTFRREGDILGWDYYDPSLKRAWAYPFSVDGTFYDKAALLDTVRRLLYHNPVTLESYVLGHVRSRRLFRGGYSPLCSSLMALSLNKVSYIAAENRRGDLSVERLNACFVDGYVLDYEFPDTPITREVIPRQVFAVRGNERLAMQVAPDS